MNTSVPHELYISAMTTHRHGTNQRCCGMRKKAAGRTPHPGAEVWRLHGPGRVHAILRVARDDSRAGPGWDVRGLQNDEPLFSRRCPMKVTGASWRRV